MTDKIKQWLAVITGLLLLVALLLCAGCSTPQHEPTPSENPLASLDELELCNTVLLPEDSGTSYDTQYTPAEDGAILAVSQGAVLMGSEDHRWVECMGERTDVQPEAVGFLSNDGGMVLAFGTNPVTVLLPDGQLLELPNEAEYLAGTGTAYVHFAEASDLIYIQSESFLYVYDGLTLTPMEGAVQWRGVGTVAGKAYAVGAVRTGDADDAAMQDYLFLLDETECVCVGRLEVEGAVQKLCGSSALYLMTDRALYAWTETSFTCLDTLVALGLSCDAIVDLAETEDELQLAEAQGIYTLLPGSEGGSITVTAAYIPDSWNSFATAMADFNRTHTEIQIQAMAYETEADLSFALTVGEIPDIICVGDHPGYLQMLAGKNMLLALDDKLSAYLQSGDYFENIFSACALQGTTYFFCPTFDLYGMRAPASLLGTATKLDTLDALDALFQELGPDSYRWMVKEDMLYNLICDSYTAWIDEQNGTTFFETEAFYSVLEFCNRFAASQQELILDGASLPISFVQIYDPSELMRFSMKLKEETTFGAEIGYYPLPLSQFNGLGISGSYFAGICAAGTQTEAALEVLHYLLSDEVQEKAADTFCLPVSRRACEAVWNRALDGNNSEEYTAYVNGFTDQFKALVEGADHLNVAAAPEIRDIILEEAASYFAGAKSVEAVSAVIQNRVLLYLAERS